MKRKIETLVSSWVYTLTVQTSSLCSCSANSETSCQDRLEERPGIHRAGENRSNCITDVWQVVTDASVLKNKHKQARYRVEWGNTDPKWASSIFQLCILHNWTQTKLFEVLSYWRAHTPMRMRAFLERSAGDFHKLLTLLQVYLNTLSH